MWGNLDARGRDRKPKCRNLALYDVIHKKTSDRSGVREDHTASFFSHENEEARGLRERIAEDSLEMLISWLKEGGNVGIHGMSFYLDKPRTLL
jgi:hypothetical protein